MLIDKSKKTDIIKINNNFCTEKNKYTYVALKDILNNNTENAIFTLDEKEYNLLEVFIMRMNVWNMLTEKQKEQLWTRLVYEYNLRKK